MNKPRAPTARAFALAALAAVGCSLPLSGEEIIVRHLVDASLPSPADDSDSPDDSNDVASNDSSSGFDGYSPPTMAQIECGRLCNGCCDGAGLCYPGTDIHMCGAPGDAFACHDCRLNYCLSGLTGEAAFYNGWCSSESSVKTQSEYP